MSIGNYYKLITRGQYGAVQTRNEFWFLQLSGTDGATRLLATANGAFLTAILAVTSSDFGYTGIDVYNHNNPIDFVEDTFPLVAGTGAPNPLPPSNALAFTTPRKRVGMRAGQKRFCGLQTNVTANGVIVNAPFLALCDDLALIMSSPLVDTDEGNSWQMIIVKRVNVGTSTNPDYRIPDVIPSDGYYLADAWFVKPNVSTQNSRKYGHGI